ncbi:helix-turn-helix domain-containing protein [Flavobacterium sp. '19STA2R22 D10 B1']|uniref:helix-turn-helix domain-containing protein n=1 Tax=Flavobacterium aerium TaxID=3037261 RepID=UPI00278BF874|nr:helix-turn-helix domain-containing protein [Flavobacterium sp. '19STA2R22 D10 B1']
MNHYLIPDDFLIETDSKEGIHIHHYHSTYEYKKNRVTLKTNAFSFLLKGYKNLLYNGHQSENIEPREFIFMKSGNYLMSEKLTEENEYHSILLFFDNQFLASFVLKYAHHFPKKEKSSTVVIKGQIDNYISHFLESLQFIEASDRIAKTIKLEELFLYLIQHQNLNIKDLLNEQNQNEQFKIQEVIHNNWRSNLQVSELAFLCNMSISSFKRHFEHIYHCSPVKWIQKKRLEYAAEQLLQSSNRANDIYLEMGYQSLSSFIQAFKQNYGMTPKQYQKHNLDV